MNGHPVMMSYIYLPLFPKEKSEITRRHGRARRASQNQREAFTSPLSSRIILELFPPVVVKMYVDTGDRLEQQ
jgi:hypothetical protein